MQRGVVGRGLLAEGELGGEVAQAEAVAVRLDRGAREGSVGILRICASDEVHDKTAYEALPEDKRMTARGIEVGHIFYFGEKYSKPMKAMVTGPDGKDAPIHGGS